MNRKTPKPHFNCEPLKSLVRTVPDFPKPGILFYDITTLLKDKTGFAQMIDALAAHYIADEVDLVLGIEARGFIFGQQPALNCLANVCAKLVDCFSLGDATWESGNLRPITTLGGGMNQDLQSHARIIPGPPRSDK